MMQKTHFNPKPFRCWLFCTVIDNFGDIGVSWRLARELTLRLGWHVDLWLDDFSALHTIAPDALHNNLIQLHHWREGEWANDSGSLASPDLVIETFACHLPENILKIIEQYRPLWLNWEYLSAEDWAIRTHLMPSLQSNACAKYFWQMGFVPQSGGLLRENHYLNQKETFEKNHPRNPHNIHIFAFGYASDVWAKWCETWANLPHKIILHVAGQFLHRALPERTHGNLNIIHQNFVPQENFDELLWAADINIIRGEDSFVRAQYAAKPFFWQIYPQDEAAHLDKLDAFWTMAQQNWQDNLRAAHTALSGELNGAYVLNDDARAQYWTCLLDNWGAWQREQIAWQAQLFAQTDAVTQLSQWVEQKKSV